MRFNTIFILFLAAICLAGKCGKPKPGIDLAPTASPINLDGVNAKFIKDIPYDAYPLTVFDIFLPESSSPVPIVLMVHGGGFTGGDKANFYKNPKTAGEIKGLLKKGIAVANINYRLLKETDKEGVIKPLGDSKRCLQFIRYHAAEVNIDKDKVAMYGHSAGAGTSLWLAYHDEMADAGSTDPVLKESTRVKAVAAFATQATYDLLKWSSVVFDSYGMTQNEVLDVVGNDKVKSFYGIGSLSELTSPAIEDYRQEVDMLYWQSDDDPPTWVENPNPTSGKPEITNPLFHHYKHGEVLFENAPTGSMAHLSAKPFTSGGWQGVVDFLSAHLL